MEFTIPIKREPDEELDDMKDIKYYESDGQTELSPRVTARKRGRPKGSGKKRKAEEELSINPNTIKARKRFEAMSAAEKQWDSAKRSDKYDLKKHESLIKETESYKAADVATKIQIIDRVKAERYDYR
jgi:hypothetical protein